MPATIKDIAYATGLSTATVSKYINGFTVRPENQQIIAKAINQMDFHVNEMARSLKTNRSRTIGVIIPEITNVIGTQIISQLEEILRENGYGILVCDGHSDEDIEAEALRFLLDKKVDGIINMPVSRTGRHLLNALPKSFPVVLLDIAYPQLPFDAVIINNISISRQATDLLLQRGHRTIGFIGGPADTLTTQERQLGYIQALTEYHIPISPDLIVDGLYTCPGGYQAMQSLLQQFPNMTAAFVTDCEMTLGAIMAINEHNLCLYEDIAFIGFDGNNLCRFFSPHITSVVQPIADISKQAAELMLRRLKNPNASRKICCLDAQLVFQYSVKDLLTCPASL